MSGATIVNEFWRGKSRSYKISLQVSRMALKCHWPERCTGVCGKILNTKLISQKLMASSMVMPPLAPRALAYILGH